MQNCFNFTPASRNVRASRLLAFTSSAVLVSALVGCGSGALSTTVDTVAETSAPVHGNVHGGQQPVSGSHIYLYAVGTSGYGSASISLLPAQTGAVMDANGNYYVTTDAAGNFAFTVTGIACPKASTQTYLLALGGNPGYPGNVNNTAISAMIPAGKCNSIGTSSIFTINEATTVATVTALQQFMVDATHIGGSASLQAGIKNGFGLAADLVYPGFGTTNTTNVAGTGSIPTKKINAIANALAPCLNAATAGDPACTSLFSAVTPSGGTQPTDIVGAMLLIAKNPGNNAANIYGQAIATPPFQPTINASAPPQDLTLAITYAGGGMTAPGNIVIDANNNAFIGNSPSTAGVSGTDSIVGFGPDGTILTGAAGYTTGIHAPNALAFDNAGFLWSTDLASGSSPDEVVRLTSAGALGFAFSDATISGPQGIAINSNNNAWVVNQNNSKVVKISTAPARTVTVSTGSQTFPTGVGIDGSGNIWVSETGNGSIAEFNTSGTFLSPTGGYNASSLTQPIGISLDGAGNVWTINNDSSLITVLDKTGSLVAPTAPQPSISNAYVLAIDGAGGAWYANCRVCSTTNNGSPDNLTHVLANQSQSTGTADGYQDPHLSRVGSAAIDGGGNVWVTNNAGGTVTEFIGVAAPVVTPLAVAVATNKIGIRP